MTLTPPSRPNSFEWLGKWYGTTDPKTRSPTCRLFWRTSWSTALLLMWPWLRDSYQRKSSAECWRMRRLAFLR